MGTSGRNGMEAGDHLVAAGRMWWIGKDVKPGKE